MNKKLIATTTVFFGTLILALIAYFLTTNIGKNQVAIYTLPTDASITIDGKSSVSGINYLTAGEYSIRVERRGFAPQTIVKQIVDSENTPVIVALEPVSDEGRKWLEDNSEAAAEFESKAGAAANTEGELFEQKNPIVKELPYKNYLFTIGYRVDPKDPSGQSIILEIDAPEVYRQQALTQIYNLGYDPTDYSINFRNFRNDF